MKVIFSKEAQKQYGRLAESDKKKIDKKISLLSSQPFVGKKLSGEYKDLRSLKAWPYRIIYVTDEIQKEIWIVSIIHRQGAYK